MEITLLIKSIIGLVFILGFLIFLMLTSFKNKKMQQGTSKNGAVKTATSHDDSMQTDLESLRKIIKDKNSDKQKLKEALDLVIKYHGTIHKKLGLRTHPDFAIYKDIILSICRHKNTNKNLILDFDKSLEKLNPEYKSDINDALTNGLNSRGL